MVWILGNSWNLITRVRHLSKIKSTKEKKEMWCNKLLLKQNHKAGCQTIGYCKWYSPNKLLSDSHGSRKHMITINMISTMPQSFHYLFHVGMISNSSALHFWLKKKFFLTNNKFRARECLMTQASISVTYRFYGHKFYQTVQKVR